MLTDPAGKMQRKAGTPPGTLIHIGERRIQDARVTVCDYSEESVEEREIQTAQECVTLSSTTTVTWLSVEGLHEVPVIEAIGQCFGLHPLVLEDILETDHRPKLEQYDEYTYLVARMFRRAEDDQISSEQVSILLFPHAVITFTEGRTDLFETVRRRIHSGQGRMRKAGADYLAYALLDAIIDSYFGILEEIGDRIEAVEDELIEQATPRTLVRINWLKREVALVRKAVGPMREVMMRLERGETGLITESTLVFLRDAYDHIVHLGDTIETYRDLLAGMLDTYLSTVSNRMNEIMKVLTIIATVFIPLTFVAGIYGMNFQYMPELQWRFGYPAVLVLMLAVGVWMLAYFRRRRWL